ncbi:ethanolamine ammonia-lyase small subunit [Herbaspirillum sp. Sphag1AN]|uniref:ethanolamine ammonia-lyase subunit EutC n=1 Tax=unclassified Herbaspirillum TaxID=2624150 RepID=UPI00160F59F7|nr:MULTISPECIES: ethanolamine ammonia-lyase subunit EutC [unclassified Herbaspirillum]MBB3213451.1 ethanolamine ammonia-lyase small subunit [Herbaspirillum sp. Sphag1AN]MBB3246505.1 ethanolamine ammonia-lyase small subunit [Herbaspirillum sp. Sphag64]
MPTPPTLVTDNPWHTLRRYTAARIALGRAGVSLPTNAQLAFQLAHAQARDAVHLALDAAQLQQQLIDANIHGASTCKIVDSAASDRLTYLQRPDLGRRLSDDSRKALDDGDQARHYDLAFVIADGLSSLAITRNAVPFLAVLQSKIAARHWTLAPLSIVRQGRVAIGDEIGSLLHARLVVILIGERPGLSSPDSMGLYLTWMPTVGMNDAQRNCISNVRPQGMSYEEAATKLDYLLAEALRRELTGVALKDESSTDAPLKIID